MHSTAVELNVNVYIFSTDILQKIFSSTNSLNFQEPGAVIIVLINTNENIGCLRLALKRCDKARVTKDKRVSHTKIDIALELVKRAKENELDYEWVSQLEVSN